MKFNLIDRIITLEPRQRIHTIKALSLSEEYLADHFPTFPVMPGVLMLECMIQSATWLVRLSEDFAHSICRMAEVRNVIYKSFVAPGRTLNMVVECSELTPQFSEFSGRGSCNETEVFKAKLRLEHLNLADRDTGLASVDQELKAHARKQLTLIYNGVGS